MRYVTMSPSGMYGGYYDAHSDEEAKTMAEAEGYEVAEVIDPLSESDIENFDFIVVVT
jgi:hypothetical protein